MWRVLRASDVRSWAPDRNPPDPDPTLGQLNPHPTPSKGQMGSDTAARANHHAFLEQRTMSGSSCIRGLSALILGLALIQTPPQLQAQTSAERIRVEEIRRALERTEAQQHIQLERIEAALVQAREQAAQNEHETQQAVRARMEVLEQALVEAQARLGQERGQHQEQSQKALQRAQEQIEKYQQVVVRARSRIRLGVTLTSDQDEEMDGQGVLLSGIMDNSPAQEAGLLEGDILTHLNGHSLINPIPGEDDEEFNLDGSLPVQRLLFLVQELDEGDEVDLRYLREGSRNEVSFLAAELDEPNVMVWSYDEDEPGRKGYYQFDPDEESVWTFAGPDKKFIELKLSELENLDEIENLTIELSELEGLDRLKDLRVYSKDNFFDSGDFRVHASPEGAFRFYSSEEGDSPSSVGFYERGDFPSSFRVWGGGAGFGLEVTELNPELGEYFSASEGLLILSVDKEDNTLNLAAGDVVLAIDGRDVEDQGDLWRILGSYEDSEAVTFTVVRKGQRQEVEGAIG